MNNENWGTNFIQEASERDDDRIQRAEHSYESNLSTLDRKLKQMFEKAGIPLCFGSMPTEQPIFLLPKPSPWQYMELEYGDDDEVVGEKRTKDEANKALSNYINSLDKAFRETIDEHEQFLKCANCLPDIFKKCATFAGMYQPNCNHCDE